MILKLLKNIFRKATNTNKEEQMTEEKARQIFIESDCNPLMLSFKDMDEEFAYCQVATTEKEIKWHRQYIEEMFNSYFKMNPTQRKSQKKRIETHLNSTGMMSYYQKRFECLN